MKIDETIFKAYDIRGIYPSQVNEEGFYKIAQAYAKLVNPKTVALGRDVRLSGEKLMDAVKRGLIDHGVNVVDIGVITTDMFYFASAAYDRAGNHGTARRLRRIAMARQRDAAEIRNS